ncbi:hypothetical protein V5D56_18100 [Cellulosimicrobium sp. PMB13]|uniref:hypothetical protein n=1 Tax=Cellulosimicrobium sp. PMB13 TaxID=3120158 RepID=UPI003F4C49EF
MTTTLERPSRDTTATLSPPRTATRLRRPTWRDPRLLVGLVVVAASVALGSWAVAAAGHTDAVYAADAVLTPGDRVSAQDLRAVEVRLGSGTDDYLLAADGVPEDAVVLRTVEPGELVPASALGAADDLTLRTVAVPVTSGLSDRIVAGAAVDLWHVPPAPSATGAQDAPVAEPGPAVLVEGVTVAEIDEAGGTFVAGGPVTIHVLVASDDLATVLGAVAGEGSIAVVPVGGAG